MTNWNVTHRTHDTLDRLVGLLDRVGLRASVIETTDGGGVIDVDGTPPPRVGPYRISAVPADTE